MVSFIFNKSPLSSREKKVLEVFHNHGRNVSENLVREITGMNRAAVNQTIKKLRKKNYIKKATVSKVTFYRENLHKLKKVKK